MFQANACLHGPTILFINCDSLCELRREEQQSAGAFQAGAQDEAQLFSTPPDVLRDDSANR
jgi:hypothetical protein